MAEMTMSLQGRRVVVIGGATGIGFAVAELALAQGAEVVVASSRRANVDAAVARLGTATGGTVDLRDEADVARFFESLGAFDHLAITAGDWTGTMFGGVRDLDLAAARAGLDVRFWGSLTAAKHASATIATGGSITLTSGMLAHRPRAGTVMATAGGGAMEFLARALAADLAPLRVNAVCPGLVLTEHVRQTMPAETVEAYVGNLPLPRGATPAEAATAYVYLMMASYVTGQVLPVDGGGLLV